MWRERLQGKFKASPVAGDGKVYFVSEAGVVTVVRAGPKFKVLARNDMGEGIEASKIAGHSTVRMTEEYTKIQLTRQEEFMRRIQERLASVGEKQPAAVVQ